MSVFSQELILKQKRGFSWSNGPCTIKWLQPEWSTNNKKRGFKFTSFQISSSDPPPYPLLWVCEGDMDGGPLPIPYCVCVCEGDMDGGPPSLTALSDLT